MSRETNPAPRPLARLTAVLPRPALWLLPCAVIAGALAGLVYGSVKAPQYAATSYVVVVPDAKKDPAAALGFAQAYGRVAVDVAVEGGAAGDADVSRRTLRDGVTAATSPDAPMISLTARSTSAATAVAMADSAASALVEKSAATKKTTGVEVLGFSRAGTPSAPASPSAAVAALVGGCAAGLLAGLALLVRPRRSAPGAYAPVPAPASAALPQKEPV
ncbi:lipopolysaccharide biosynthesis protein [Streptomyces sp. NPDC060194]|uniref:lipopolysaccharide biosynthesis protein n=1 Tax=Streptomyces sp. NPDC060194 TaxID=3347069 RepID=UPI003663CE60